MPTPHAHTEATLTRALRRQLAREGWAVVSQVQSASVEHEGRRVSRRIDVLALRRPAEGDHIETAAFEIKTTRQDFMSDVRNPAKQAPWVAAAGRHYYVAPQGVIPDGALPASSGLVEVSSYTSPAGAVGDVLTFHHGPVLAEQAPTWLVYAVAQRAAESENVLSGAWMSDDATAPGYTPEAVARINALEHEVALAQRRLARATETANAWKQLAARQGHKVPCATCGRAIVPSRVSAGVLAGWKHAQPDLAGDCPATKTGVTPREEHPEGNPA